MGNRIITADWEETGLAGTLTAEVRDLEGNILRAAATTGITESPAGSGIYALSIPDTWSGRAIWTDGVDTEDGYFDAIAGPLAPGIAPTAPSRFNNSFEYVAVICDNSRLAIRIAAIRNLSTVGPGSGPGYGSTDRGRMFGRVTLAGDVLTVKLFSDAARTVEICTGVGTADNVINGDWLELSAGAQAVHGESARVAVTMIYAGADPRTVNFVCFPSFADDSDVFPDPSMCAALPGYDTGIEGGSDAGIARGLAFYHAKAVKQLLTTSLPANIPHLFGGAGLSALVPMDESEIAFPDLRTIANVDQLREAQAALVLAMAADASRHLKEFADMADAARDRFKSIMEEIRLANEPADIQADDETEAEPGHGGVSFGSFNRG